MVLWFCGSAVHDLNHETTDQNPETAELVVLWFASLNRETADLNLETMEPVVLWSKGTGLGFSRICCYFQGPRPWVFIDFLLFARAPALGF